MSWATHRTCGWRLPLSELFALLLAWSVACIFWLASCATAAVDPRLSPGRLNRHGLKSRAFTPAQRNTPPGRRQRSGPGRQNFNVRVKTNGRELSV